MSKGKYVKTALKYTWRLFLLLLKIAFVFLPRLFKQLFQVIQKRMRFSITFKTTVSYTVVFTVLLFLFGCGLTGAFVYFQYDQTNEALKKDAQLVSQMIKQSEELPREQLRAYANITGIIITLFDKDMNPIYTTGNSNSPNPPSSMESPRTSISPDWEHLYLHSTTSVNLSYSIRTIEVSLYPSQTMFYLPILLAGMVAGVFLIMIISIFIGARTSRRMLRPIDQMTRTARSISAGDLSTRLDVGESHDELKDLAETFNEMLERLQISFEQQNQFVANASHELRTPIAVVQGYANLIERWGKEDKEVLEESINAIINESAYMKDLVEKLLFLASTDKNTKRLQTSPCALNELVEEVLKETRLIDTQHDILGDTNTPVCINGDRDYLKQALRIIIDNSLKFTPAGGWVRINSCVNGRKVIISVEDNGIGISPEDLPYIFNRFYKCDKSRNREKGGVGLGLSIAKWILEQHQGQIQVESTSNRGTKFTLSLPAIETSQ